MSDTPNNDPPPSTPPPPDPQAPWAYSGGISGRGQRQFAGGLLFRSGPRRRTLIARRTSSAADLCARRPPRGRAAPPPHESSAPKPAELASVIDTIEAIIIALIIALTFRAFIVEAFVIPTGSMAPTLLGAHFKVICPKCGYVFDREARLNTQWEGTGLANMGERPELHSNTTVPLEEVTCPNCHYVVPPSALPEYLPDESRERWTVRNGRFPLPGQTTATASSC